MSGWTLVDTDALLAERLAATSLTARERAVLGLLFGGKTRAEAARTLGITEGTLRNHLRAAYQRLRVVSRLEALALLLGKRPLRGKEEYALLRRL